MSFNFYAKDLDGAYEKIRELDVITTKEGIELETNLKTLIGNLRNHWKGNDANIHINNLMTVCRGLHTLIDEINSINHNASESVIKVQEVRNMNGANGNVGGVIPLQERETLVFEQLDPTIEYYLDPVNSASDYNSLANVCDMFDSFCKDIYRCKEELLSNWVSGSDHEKAVAAFSEFESNVASYRQSLNKSRDDLYAANKNLRNIEQVS